MNITTRAALVLQQVDERISRPMLGARERTALRCLRTAIEELLGILSRDTNEAHAAFLCLATLCDQWEAGQ